MAIIEALGAREILDSRGNPTVEVEIQLEMEHRHVLQFQVVHQLVLLKQQNFVMVASVTLVKV